MDAALAAPRRRGSVQRRIEIVSAASRLIRRRGYSNVSMKDIATAVGISAPALYKHFACKQDLLSVTVGEGLRMAERAAHLNAKRGLRATLTALADVAVDERRLWVLLNRETRHLDPVECRELGKRFAALIDVVAERIMETRSEINRERADILAQTVLATLSAPSQYSQSLSKRALAEVLAEAALRGAWNDDRPGGLSVISARLSAPFDPSLHRREAIMDAAARLFANHGYDAVSLDDIGSAVSIAGPSIYNHFEGKSDILAGILWRSLYWIESGMSLAIAEQVAPEAALRQIYADYAAVAIGHRELFRVFTIEAVHLDRTERDRIGRAHTHFVETWTALLRRHRPTLDLGTARALVTASLSVVNDLADRAPFKGQPERTPVLVSIAMTVAGIRDS